MSYGSTPCAKRMHSFRPYAAFMSSMSKISRPVFAFFFMVFEFRL